VKELEERVLADALAEDVVLEVRAFEVFGDDEVLEEEQRPLADVASNLVP